MDILKRSTFIDCDDKTVTKNQILDILKIDFGPANGGYYVPFFRVEDADVWADVGVDVNEKRYCVLWVSQKTFVVSFLDLPEFVTDDAITEKLKALNCLT